jgi:guanylate kinase
MKNNGKLFIVSAPSGAGKTTIVNLAIPFLQKDFPIKRVLTCTSRPPRTKEKEGIDYSFISKDTFESKIKDRFFLEYMKYADHYYGSPSTIFSEMKNGTSFIMIIDLVGAKKVKELVPNATFIWITPPSINALKKRLFGRNTETAEKIQTRLDTAQKEIEEEHSLPLFSHHIINDDLQIAVTEFIAIIKNKLAS